MKDYRPVSLLCSFFKVFVMTLHERLYKYYHQKICSEQHGFMKEKSVKTNLCTFLDCIVQFVHGHQQIDVIYCDMSNTCASAYSCWFRSYLFSRTNFVRVSGFMSEPFLFLGPLLFSSFVDRIVFSVKKSKVLLFADDIKLFRQYPFAF